MSKTIPCHLISLNCNSLVKSASSTQQSSFLCFLYNLNSAIYAFQDTRIKDNHISKISSPIKIKTTFMELLLWNNFLFYSNVEKIHPDWSDHSILRTSLIVDNSKTGPDMWRANPAYLDHPNFLKNMKTK
ncbi:unnamed protein product [Cunninghamella blakesleeana]